MKVLFLSNLYPNKEEPTRATFNRQKVAHLNKHCDIVVVAPVARFPFKPAFPGGSSKIPFKESIDGLDVYHPRVFYTPKVLRFLYGFFYFWSVRAFIKKLHSDFKFDIIFCAWAYPDGYAAMKLAAMLNKPFVVLAHGSDLHFHIKAALRRRLMKETFLKADKVITVSRELKDRILELGVPQDKVAVVYDGVDHQLFLPMDKVEAKRKLGLAQDKRVALFVGNLVSVKGLKYLLAAAGEVGPLDWALYIVGGGYLEKPLKKVCRSMGLEGKVVFCGPRPHEQIPLWLNASEVLCLSSLAEGLPDIIIEALSCGVPVVASRVGGIPEIINDEGLGILVKPGDARSLAEGINAALAKSWDRDDIRRYSSRFNWEDNSFLLFECLKSCLPSTPRISG